MKYQSRGYTSCDPCRKLKRKCDLIARNFGSPCSTCQMRKIADQCVISKRRNFTIQLKEAESSDVGKWNSTPYHTQADRNSDLAVGISTKTISITQERGCSGSSVSSETSGFSRKDSLESSNKSNESNYSSENNFDGRQTSTFPSPISNHEICRLISLNFITACVSAMFTHPEWCFFLNRQVMLEAALQWNSPQLSPDLFGLLCISSAGVTIREGLRRLPDLTGSGIRTNCHEHLYKAYTASLSYQTNCIWTVQSLILRAYYHTHLDHLDDAWKSMYQAVAAYYALGYKNLQDSNKDDESTSLWIALCTLEDGLCMQTGRPSILMQQISGGADLKNSFMNRRWKTLCLTRKVNCLLLASDPSRQLDSTGSLVAPVSDTGLLSSSTSPSDNTPLTVSSSDPRLEEFNDLEMQLQQAIVQFDELEGRLLSFGQALLCVCIMKLRKRRLHIFQKLTNAKLNVQDLQVFVDYGELLVVRLESIRVHEPRPLFGCVPFLAPMVFQAITCVWLLSAQVDKDSEIGRKMLNMKENFIKLIDAVKQDILLCKRTETLHRAMESLEKSQLVDSYLEIPIENVPANISSVWQSFQRNSDTPSITPKSTSWPQTPVNPSSGLSNFSAPLTDEDLRLNEAADSLFFSLDPTFDDMNIWSVLTAASTFDPGSEFRNSKGL